MGILGDAGGSVLGTADTLLSTLVDPFKKKADYFGQDFPEGFEISEYVNGVEKDEADGYGVTLAGDMMPFQPFPFGGEQRVKKDYYPGNPEPVVQILGPQESDVVIKGRLKGKRFKNSSGKKPDGDSAIPSNFQKQLDAIRIRGNLLKITLGTWQRYAFLEKTHFDLSQLNRIEYELTFTIIGFNPPTNCKMVDRTKDIPFNINKELINASSEFEANLPPATIPKNIARLLNDAISLVGTAVGLVTNFVDTTVKTAQEVESAINRAIGLIKNARSTISQYKRTIRTFQLDIATIGSTFTDKNGGLGTNIGAVLGISNNLHTTQTRATIAANTYINAAYITGTVTQSTQLSEIMARLEAQFAAISETAPLARYLIKQGDTLQKIAIKYYNDATLWKTIYDHNNMTSTALVPSTIIEIPKK